MEVAEINQEALGYNEKALNFLKSFYQSHQSEIEAKFNESEDYRNKIVTSVKAKGFADENWHLITRKEFGYIGQGITRKPISLEETSPRFLLAINSIASLNSYDDISNYIEKDYVDFGYNSWFIKYLAVFYPDKFMPFYGSTWVCYYLDRLSLKNYNRDAFKYKSNKYYKEISDATGIPFEHLNWTLIMALGFYDLGFYIDTAFLDINRPCSLSEITEYVNAPFSKKINQGEISAYISKYCPTSSVYKGEESRYVTPQDTGNLTLNGIPYALDKIYKDKIQNKYYPWVLMQPESSEDPFFMPLMRLEPDVSGSKRENAKEDLLSRKVYADALADMIQNQKTKAPLNIGICAKWGEGKTHLMDLIKERFELANKSISQNFVSNLLNYFGLFPGEYKVKTVDFDAWEYEGQKQIWAGLIEAILKEYKKGFRAYCWFLLWKAWGQLKKLENYFKFIVCMGLFGLFYNFLVWFLPNFNDYKPIAASIQTVNVWWFSFSASLLTIISPSLIKNPFVNLDSKFLKYLEMPSYEAHLGFREEIKDLIRFAANGLTNNGRKRLVLFIDNLDRCSLENIVKVLDSICLFLDCCNGKEGNKKKQLNIVSILAIDYRIIQKAVEQKLDKENKKEEEIKLQIEEYLDKIISFPFFIPKEENISSLLCAHLGIDANYKPLEPSERKAPKTDDEIQNIDNADANEELGLKEVTNKPDSEGASGKSIELAANLRNRLKELSVDEKFYIQEVINYLHRINDFTPRMVSKFINLYFLFKYIFSYKYNKKYMYQPKAFAWWFGLALLWPDRIEPADFAIVKNLIDAIQNGSEADENLKSYYNHFREEYNLDNFFDSDSGDFMQKLNLESSIFLNKIAKL